MKTIVTQLDSRTEVSALVIKAYIVSLLLLLCVLVWSVGDAWAQYAQEYSFLPTHSTHFTFLSFPHH